MAGSQFLRRNIQKMFQQLESDCNKAINQIESRMYAREFEENGDDVFCYGIAFFKKEVLRQDKKLNYWYYFG